MPPVQTHRTLVKSLPELWAELSDAETLARHLEPFGEIRITRAVKERELTWESEEISGTVELRASGFGTKVTMTAMAPAPPEPEPEPEPEPTIPTAEQPTQAYSIPEPEPVAHSYDQHRRPPLWQRFLKRPEHSAPPPPWPVPKAVETPPEPEPEPAPVAPSPADQEREQVLTDVLDALGSAHHRPFSRS
jgi:hypothetical protein